MKPTQQEIMDVARESGIEWQRNTTITGKVRITTCGSQPVDKLERFATLLLERFSAGDGEPFGYFCDWGDHDGLQRIAMYYGEPGSATFDDWNEYPKVHKNLPLYTHSSPTDLQAAYERGLDDAKKEVEQFNVDGVGAIADAIEALKGKQ